MSHVIYDVDWPCTSCRWGPVISKSDDYVTQKVYLGLRTDGTYTEHDNLWKGSASYIVVAHIGNAGWLAA